MNLLLQIIFYDSKSQIGWLMMLESQIDVDTLLEHALDSVTSSNQNELSTEISNEVPGLTKKSPIATTEPSDLASTSFSEVIKSEVAFGLIKEHFTCSLCNGILVDVCTVVECLHSFCRSCLIHHLYNSNKCPTCSCQLSEVPFKDIKSDPRLQVSRSHNLSLFSQLHF